MTIEQKAKAYDEALKRAKILYNDKNEIGYANAESVLEEVFPLLKESEDEKIRKELIEHVKDQQSSFISAPDCRDKYEEEENNKYNSWLAWLEKQGEQKSIDKIEPKFKVKYAGSEYNVFETKDIAGVTYYGIEDEPNHIDYVLPDNCEIISGYSVKEKGSPYPTKSAIFSEQNPAWGEEDENKINTIIQIYHPSKKIMDWLKSLKQRYTWKPSEEQINALSVAVKHGQTDDPDALKKLLEQLKKLKE